MISGHQVRLHFKFYSVKSEVPISLASELPPYVEAPLIEICTSMSRVRRSMSNSPSLFLI